MSEESKTLGFIVTFSIVAVGILFALLPFLLLILVLFFDGSNFNTD